MRWAKFVKDHRLLESGVGITMVQADLIFVDIAKHSKRPVAEVRNVNAAKLKIGWPDFLDCCLELAHAAYPALPLREGGAQELVFDVLEAYSQSC